MMASIVDTGERGSDTNGGHIKDQDRGVPEELLVRRSALSERGRIETVINIKIGTTGTNDTHIPSPNSSKITPNFYYIFRYTLMSLCYVEILS